MPAKNLPSRLTSQAAVTRHLRRLAEIDPRLRAIHEAVGAVPARSRPPGFAGLARVVCGQQVSVASADAIWRRLEAVAGAATPEGFLRLGEHGLQGVGLSRGKFQTLTGVAQAIVAGELDLPVIERLPTEEALAQLTSLKGIGPWTAEIYLMFCAGHPDIFPAGDIALQKAVGDALGLGRAPDRNELVAIAAAWAPHRAAAALLFWRFYRKTREREGLGL
jgi:DNA-3-methyladenine glycosylase II